MKTARWEHAAAIAGSLAVATAVADGSVFGPNLSPQNQRRARNVIFFVGDGMGVSTVSATRVFSVGVAGQLVIDQFPYTALSRTYSSDSITPDSAPTMTAMMSGVNTNQSVIGFDDTTEPSDFNQNGDGEAPWTLLELAKARGMKVGVVSTAQITHATPAATYAHINQRNNENDIALQTLPSDSIYNQRLGSGIDVLMGGGRRFFLRVGTNDEEGGAGSRSDGRDLRNVMGIRGWAQVLMLGIDPAQLRGLTRTGQRRTMGAFALPDTWATARTTPDRRSGGARSTRYPRPSSRKPAPAARHSRSRESVRV